MFIREITFKFVKSSIPGDGYLCSEFLNYFDACLEQILDPNGFNNCIIIKINNSLSFYAIKTIVKIILEEYCKKKKIPFRFEDEHAVSMTYSFEL